jgi:CheY-like chemotaxis protein
MVTRPILVSYASGRRAEMKEILVVDDDIDTLEIVAELLREAGYEARTATTGAEALARIRRSLPDLLLIDLFMPVMDGWQFLDLLRADPEMKRLPAVVMTAWPRPVDLPSGISLLKKPFEWDALLRIIRKHCGGDAVVKCLPQRDAEPTRVPMAASIRQ